jgi:hypothetical protein
VFERELEVYRARLPELLGDEGKFAVLLGDEVAGVFDDHDEAVDAGYLRYGKAPYLVKRIELEPEPPGVEPPPARGPRVRLQLWQVMALVGAAAVVLFPFAEVGPAARWVLLDIALIRLAVFGVLVVPAVLVARLLVRRNGHALMAAALPCGLVLGGLMWVRQHADARRDAFQEARRLGHIRFDWERESRPNPGEVAAGWLGDWVEAEFFVHLLSDVAEVRVRDPNVTVADLKRLEQFPRLEALVVWSSGMTDAGLGQLARLRNLEEIELHGAMAVTDAGLAPLTALPKLRSLVLSIPVTDAALVHVRNMPALRKLDLRMSDVTEAGVAALRRSRPDLKIITPDLQVLTQDKRI